MDVDTEWVDYLSKRMYDAVMTRIPDVTLNGDVDKRYPGNLNFSFAYVEVRTRNRSAVVSCCCRDRFWSTSRFRSMAFEVFLMKLRQQHRNNNSRGTL